MKATIIIIQQHPIQQDHFDCKMNIYIFRKHSQCWLFLATLMPVLSKKLTSKDHIFIFAPAIPLYISETIRMSSV